MDMLQDLAGRIADLFGSLGPGGWFRLFIGILGGMASLAALYDVATRAHARRRHARRERDGEQDEQGRQ